MASNSKEDVNLSHPTQNANGSYANPWKTWREKSARELASWFFRSPHAKLPDKKELNEQLPVVRPTFDDNIPEDGVKATWLGHATVLFHLDGVRVLCDPVFSERCSAVQFMGPKRVRPAPCQVKDLPEIHAIVISHNHYDHLDTPSVRHLGYRFPNAEWFVPIGLKAWFVSTVNSDRINELSWWGELPLFANKEVRIVATPAQHWSARHLMDRNMSLWCGWAFIGPKHRAWFAGDTGYCSAFLEIGKKLGPFDLAAIPIGAYEPRWFMCHQHVDPEQAVKVHKDIGSKRSLGIHWGTFMLTSEPCMEPPQKLLEALKEADISPSEFVIVNHGETLYTKDDGSHTIDQ